MKLFHISDLHLGRQLHGFSLLADQRHLLHQILSLIKEHRPDALCIAGDIFDKSVPAVEAVVLWDEFLTEVSGMEAAPAVFAVSGNHDSAERLQYAGTFLSRQRIHIAAMPQEESQYMRNITLKDDYGSVSFYLLPFLKPSYLKHSQTYTEEESKSYQAAVEAVVKRCGFDPKQRNVLVAHQFFTYGQNRPEPSDSETISIGGQDQVDISCIKAFDYVALGHIHRPQQIGWEHIRYSGSPFKYSVSEARDRKAVSVVELKEKGTISISSLPLNPLHDVRRIQGTLQELTSEETLLSADADDYVSAVLTDEQELIYAQESLQHAYPNLLEWRIENARTKHQVEEGITAQETQSPLEQFQEFYLEMNGQELTKEQAAAIEAIMADSMDGGSL